MPKTRQLARRVSNRLNPIEKKTPAAPFKVIKLVSHLINEDAVSQEDIDFCLRKVEKSHAEFLKNFQKIMKVAKKIDQARGIETIKHPDTINVQLSITHLMFMNPMEDFWLCECVQEGIQSYKKSVGEKDDKITKDFFYDVMNFVCQCRLDSWSTPFDAKTNKLPKEIYEPVKIVL